MIHQLVDAVVYKYGLAENNPQMNVEHNADDTVTITHWPYSENATPIDEPDAAAQQVIVDEYSTSVVQAEKEATLYYACLAYQNDRMDTNTSNEVTKSEALVEAGRALETDLPNAKAVGDWVESLWDEYYIRKADVFNASLDFTGFDPIPYSFAEIRTERKDFIATLP